MVAGAPFWPFGPVSPVWPFCPLSPVGPVAPISPFWPLGPVSPVWPFCPFGPVGPESGSTQSIFPFPVEANTWPIPPVPPSDAAKDPDIFKLLTNVVHTAFDVKLEPIINEQGCARLLSHPANIAP